MMKKSWSGSNLGGVINIKADLSTAAGGYVQFDCVRPPVADLDETLGLSVQAHSEGQTGVFVLHDSAWVSLHTDNVPQPSHIEITRRDVFIWTVAIRSALDPALSRNYAINMQDDFVDPLLSEAAYLAKRNAEREADMRVDLYVNSQANLTNLSIRAEKNVW